MYDAYGYYNDDDDFSTDTTVAWQEYEGGRWSKTHDTNDHGRTTLCGAKVPEVVWMNDGFSTQGSCKRCINARRKTGA